ncbi:MAG: hypothetical protein R2991_07725 [Thermoanaerobaculia bacterium]
MRSKRLMALSMSLFAWVGLMAATAEAGVLAFRLQPMNPAIEVDGLVKMTKTGGTERLDLRVFTGELKEGTMLHVSIVRDGASEPVEIARIKLVLGSALLQMDSRKDVSPLFPFKGVTEFIVWAPGRGNLAHGSVPGTSAQ